MKRLILLSLLIFSLFSLGDLFIYVNAQQTLEVSNTNYLVPRGMIDPLDGEIGSGWDSALMIHSVLFEEGNRYGGNQLITLYAKHDGSDLCFAMEVPNSSRYSQFFAKILIDDGDRLAREPGDDLIRVPDTNGVRRFHDLDYGFAAVEKLILDEQDAEGAVKWHEDNVYVAELCTEMNSGHDPNFDVAFSVGDTLVIAVGMEFTTNISTTKAWSSGFTIVLAP